MKKTENYIKLFDLLSEADKLRYDYYMALYGDVFIYHDIKNNTYSVMKPSNSSWEK